MTSADLHWVAGFLEGEGCFSSNHGVPAVIATSTDLDVVDRVGRLFGTNILGPRMHKGSTKPAWTTAAHGAKAVGWMMTLYALMGERRRAKIKLLLDVWRRKPVSPRHRTKCPQGHDYSRENTYITKNGSRSCRKCSVLHQQAYRQRKLSQERT